MEYLSGLSESQKNAVTAPVGPIAVLAGAGSGKTRVLTHRILYLIDQGALPQSILAVTFTNKAAKEMQERVANLLAEGRAGQADSLPLVTTFHALGVRILREFHKEVGLRRYFPIYDRADSMKIIKGIFAEMGLDEKQVDPKAILSKISKEKGDGKLPEDLLAIRSSSFFLRNVGEVWSRYERALSKEGALDFDDLLIKPFRLLKENALVRETLQKRFAHLLIDEYQDTNNIQSALANILAEKSQSIFVVGDIDQNIYSWRGATIEHLLSFEKSYPSATTILLEQNYRSTKTIVDAAQAVIEKNVRRKEKKAFTVNDAGAPVRFFICSGEGEEARTIAEICRTLIAEGQNADSIAVLYRTNFQSRVLEEAMLHAGIPYQVLGTKFFDRKEVKDTLAYLRLALMPENKADLARIINVPARGIGKVTQLAVLGGNTDTLPESAQKKVAAFFSTIDRVRTAITTSKPSEAVRYAVSISGIGEQYEKIGAENEERLENIKELVTLASKYDAFVGEEGMAKLLEDVALIGEQDTMKGAGAGVRLMTVHGAKGLEFGTVFISGLEEGLFPHERKDDTVDEEEERRLFYVALTRAHHQLYLSCARTRRVYGTLLETMPSSFIGDIPAHLLMIEDGDSYAEPTIR